MSASVSMGVVVAAVAAVAPSSVGMAVSMGSWVAFLAASAS